MQRINILFPKPAHAVCRYKHGTLSSIYDALIVLLFVFITGCDTKNERTDVSGKASPETVSQSNESRKTVNEKPQQTAAVDSISSQETKKFPAQEQSGIKVTFVELGSVNCIPCKMMQPIMKEIEEEYKGQVEVVFHDVWTEEGKPYATGYNIRVIPTQVFLDKDGKEYFRHEGFFPKEQLVAVLKKQGVK